METISTLLKSFVDRKMCAGTSALISIDGKEAYFGAFGKADLETGVPFARDTIMRVFSMTKVATSVAALSLMEKGLFRLDDPVSRYLPEYKDFSVCELDENGQVRVVKAKREPTFLNLFNMTNGMGYANPESKDPIFQFIAQRQAEAKERADADAAAGQPWDTQRYAREMGKIPAAFHPGEHWLYGLGSDILGGLIVAMTGKTLYQYMKETIFDPLGMKDTFFKVPEEKQHRMAAMYTDGLDGPVRKPDAAALRIANDKIESGGGGLWSTVDDYMRFGNMLLNGGELDGVRILQPETVKLMASDHLNDVTRAEYSRGDEVGQSFGLTVRYMYAPEKSHYNESLGSFGWNGAGGTSLRIDPVRRTVLVFGIQRMPHNHPQYLPPLLDAMVESFGLKKK